jgi:sorting nexin-8
LPEPSLPYLQNLKPSKEVEVPKARASTPPQSQNDTTGPSPSRSKIIHRNSIGDPEVDPWASPAVIKSKTQPVQNDTTPSDAITAARPLVTAPASRTTSTFTTSVGDNESAKLTTSSTEVGEGSTAGPWGSIGSTNGFSSSAALGQASFASGDEQSFPTRQPTRSFGNRSSNRVEEIVTVTLLPEKEGMFMFQHRNYEVKSARRGSSVVRRYSDFVWLLDCLHKRYPFRQLPLLPPKRVAGESHT